MKQDNYNDESALITHVEYMKQTTYADDANLNKFSLH